MTLAIWCRLRLRAVAHCLVAKKFFINATRQASRSAREARISRSLQVLTCARHGMLAIGKHFCGTQAGILVSRMYFSLPSLASSFSGKHILSQKSRIYVRAYITSRTVDGVYVLPPPPHEKMRHGSLLSCPSASCASGIWELICKESVLSTTDES